ncbi:MAG: hypothetical protein RMI83_06480, partial [Desulfurococcaceae archaeon]|nr:hypothetical protein [Sulfolobales archaeon]MDW8170725.1 hypothetical protein [Desulfurococcaceae archaeon]
GLDYIGIDLWDYEPIGDGIRIKQYLVDKLKSLKNRVGRSKLIIGEIGLRIDDVEAYVEPWNKDRAIVRDEEADSRYYKSLLIQLLNLECIIPAYLGVWSWNDDSFAVRGEGDVLRVFELSLQPLALSHELTPTTTTIPHSIFRDPSWIIALSITVSTALAAYIALKRRTYFNKPSH